MGDHGYSKISSSGTFSETSSIFTTSGTFTSSSTVPGLGSLSGKAIKRLGGVVVNRVEAILIRRRLAQIEDILDPSTDSSNSDNIEATKLLYSDLLKLSRPIYSLSIRTRAFRLIMGKVGEMDCENLAEAVLDLTLPESFNLLRDMLSCLENTQSSQLAHLNSYYVEGLDAYRTQFFKVQSRYPSKKIQRSAFYLPFFLFMGLTISLSANTAFSRLVLELGIFKLITKIYYDCPDSERPSSKQMRPVHLVLAALLQNLDPHMDKLPFEQLRSFLPENENTFINLIMGDHGYSEINSSGTFSETGSIFTTSGTFTSSSTVPGLGYLSGKVIKRLGSAVVNGVDAILIQRRLAQIEDILDPSTDSGSNSDSIEATKALYGDLLELSRPVYSFSFRTRAFRLIMGKVGEMDFENLAVAISDWPLSNSYDLVKAMLVCLKLKEEDSRSQPQTLVDSSMKSARWKAYYTEGLDAYKMRLPFSLEDMPRRLALLYMPFLLCISLAVSLSTGAALSRLVLELGMFRIATKIYHDIIDSKYPLSHILSKEMRSVHLVLSALLQNLDPDTDRLPFKQLRDFLLEHDNMLTGQPIRSKHNLLASIRSTTYWRNILPLATNILLLGPGESGKTTLMKQISRTYSLNIGTCYNDSERYAYKDLIAENTLWALVKFSKAAKWNPYEDTYHRRLFDSDSLEELQSYNVTPLDLQEISRIFLLNRKAHMPEYTDYFLDSLSRIVGDEYSPSDEDIIRCYVKTSGIHPETIHLRGCEATILDFGGQIPERKKWINCFSRANIVIFVASLSDFDEVMSEDPTTNRMDDSLRLFSDLVVKSKWFLNVPVVLFLNKTDIFARKLLLLQRYFSDYSGGNNYTAGCEYIQNKFLALNKSGRDVRVYLTSAVDRGQIEEIMSEIFGPLQPFGLGETDLLSPPIQVQVQVSVSTDTKPQV